MATSPGADTEIRVLSATAMKAVLEDLAPQLERATERRVAVAYTTSGGIAKRIGDGEVADLIIAAGTEIDDLITRGKVIAGSGVVIARSGIGVAVRKGARKPDISSPEAFRRALLSARTVAYTDPAAGGASGAYFAGLLEQMGIADKVEAKLAAGGPNGLVGTIVARGDAEIGVQQIPELIAAGVDLVGPLPSDLQKPTSYVAGIPANARHADASMALIKLLTTPAAAAIIKAKGMEPG